MRRPSFSRRSFLASVGGAGALLPFLPVMDTEAGGGAFPKRILLFFYPMGTVMKNWRCAGGESDFVLSPILAPLERHRDNIVVLDGLDHEVASHDSNLLGHPGIVALWSGVEPLGGEFTTCNGTYGWSGGPSVDQFIADRYFGETPVRSLDVGVQLQTNPWSLPYARQSFRGANEPVTPEEDPAAVFDFMFEGLDLDPSEAKRIRDGRQSVLDLVKGDLRRLEAELGIDERTKFQAHLSNLEAVEHRIQNPVGAACEIPTRPPSGICRYNDTVECMEAVIPTMFDLITTAFTCDVTRVAAFMGAAEGNGPRFPANVEVGEPHSISHMTDALGERLQTEITTFWMDQLAQLLDRLDAVPEGDGTLLDNTIVVCATAESESWYHGNRNLPFVLAGGAGGAVRPGRMLRFGQYDVNTNSREPHGGRSINDLLISLCHAMDMPEVETFGNPAYCTGPIEELV